MERIALLTSSALILCVLEARFRKTLHGVSRESLTNITRYYLMACLPRVAIQWDNAPIQIRKFPTAGFALARKTLKTKPRWG